MYLAGGENMRSIKKSIGMLVVLLLIPAVLIGCGGPKIKADESAKILFNFFVKSDKSGVSKITSDQSTIDKAEKSQKDEFNKQFKDGLLKQSLIINDDQCNRVYTAYKNALKNITVTSKVASEDSKTSTVSIKTNYIDLPAIAQKAQNDALAKVKAMKLTDVLKVRQEFARAYIDELEKGLNAAKPGTATKEKTFKFTLKDNNWLPEDSFDYGKQIGSMVSNQ